MADHPDVHVGDWLKAEAERRMAMVDALPPAVQKLVHEHSHPIVYCGVAMFGKGNAPLLAQWCAQQRRIRQRELLKVRR